MRIAWINMLLAAGLCAAAVSAPGCNMDSGGGNENDNSQNSNANDNANGNDNSQNDNQNDNQNQNENQNGNGNDNSVDVTGACCRADGTCAVTEEAGCDDGTFQGADSTCEEVTCPQPTGACCDEEGACTETTRTECIGAFQGGGTACGANACDITPFTEEAEERGIEYLVIFGREDEAGSGVAFVDIDNDGDTDLLTLGRVGDGALGLFINDGDGSFTDMSDATGITPDTQARGISAADYDADGDLDLYLSMWLAPNVLLRNNGDYTFTDVTSEILADEGEGAGSAWGDYDGDGWLDLYVCNWENTFPNRLYRNLGDGTFADTGAAQGVDTLERSYQPGWIDYDLDGDVDLYVANDIRRNPDCLSGESHNRLYRNDDGNLTDVSVESGANVCLNAMSIALGDVDNNLTLDMHFTNLEPGNVLILNQGDGMFVDASEETGINFPGSIGWGSTFFDYDNDGRVELFVCNNGTANRLYENDGEFPLVDMASSLGLDHVGSTYCVAVADVDDDGDLDLAVQSRQENTKLYINHEGNKRPWVKFRVVGESPNVNGIGTTVVISAGGNEQIRQLLAGNNYKSQNEALVHFGLGTARTVDEIDVTWPGGVTRTLRDYPAEQTWTLYPPDRLGDLDGDGAIGADDLALFDACQGPVVPGCEIMDIDGDGDVDNDDM